jgi:hypothetical protein
MAAMTMAKKAAVPAPRTAGAAALAALAAAPATTPPQTARDRDRVVVTCKPVDGALQLASQALARGATELLTSTSEFTAAFASDDEPNFTGAFIDLLVSGDPNLSEVLTGDEIYRGVLNWARPENQPRPQRRRTGPGILALGFNPAHHP